MAEAFFAGLGICAVGYFVIITIAEHAMNKRRETHVQIDLSGPPME